MATAVAPDPPSVQLAAVRRLADTGAARSIREQARLSLADIARDVGVSAVSVSDWERGKYRPHGKPALRYYRLLQELAAGTAGEWSDEER